VRSRIPERGRYGARVALRRPEHPERVAIVAAVLLVVVNLAIFGTLHEVRGTASLELPAPIVSVDPQQGDHILPQDSITVGLLPKYTGRLTIDHTPIPDDQLDVTNLVTISFQPKPGHDITQLAPGDHSATIESWPNSKTYEQAKSGHLLSTYTWSFKVG
jgi:hypothetical protein